MYIFYRIILFLHVCSVILSIGPIFVLIPIAKKLKAAESDTQQVYIDIFRSAVRTVKHAGHVLVSTGVLLIVYSQWTWTTPWVVATLLVMLASGFFLARAFTPVLRKFNEPNQDKIFLVKKLTQTVWIYLFLLMIMLWFMVAKPVLW